MGYLKKTAAAGVFALMATGASAATCTGADRSISLTSASATTACYAYGMGNVNGNVAQDPLLNGMSMGGNTFELVSGPVISTLTLLDKSDQDNNVKEGALTGTLKDGTEEAGKNGNVYGTFTLGDVSGYSSLIIALKLGNSKDPGWAAFKVSNNGVFDFVVSPKQGGGLSHVNVYGVEDVAPAPVPVPASALLLLGSIGSFAALRRRKKAA